MVLQSEIQAMLYLLPLFYSGFVAADLMQEFVPNDLSVTRLGTAGRT